jgi:hypothetical protein
VTRSTKVNTPADGMSEYGPAEKDTEEYGRIIGAGHDEGAGEDNVDADWGAVKPIEGVDIPLTLTERVHEDGKDYIVLKFATGDRVSVAILTAHSIHELP